MPTAYILLNVKPESELEVIKQIKNTVKTEDESLRYEIQGVYGVYDIIVKIESENMDDVKNILGKIRRIDKISSTITMLVIEEQEV
ncbi:MAG TPA: Lrp/AsnC ligand binding domain-containing protein [Nitrosopumilaceae archaeon]|nr:Lrp/AsnC ligand binding domain-containing protein [Nitrosopumilaceae archaeon]